MNDRSDVWFYQIDSRIAPDLDRIIQADIDLPIMNCLVMAHAYHQHVSASVRPSFRQGNNVMNRDRGFTGLIALTCKRTDLTFSPMQLLHEK